MNILEKYQEQKEMLRAYYRRAEELGLIPSELRQEIEDKLDNSVLTLGVIGQMKAGKSTFLNAWIFENDILPSATTPMTAALSVITYGENPKIEVEFYTPEEWQGQCQQAERNPEEISDRSVRSKVMAARELVEASAPIRSQLSSLLGSTRADKLDNLVEYVGANGKFVSITKSVKIYYPKDYLKGVEIVDTPGFNDPIVSREERTKEFLKKADAVLLLVYAGRMFDANDHDILFNYLPQCSMGRVVIGINKYDLNLGSGETREEIRRNGKEALIKGLESSDDSSLKDMLQDVVPVPISAGMALLSHFSSDKIQRNDSYQTMWRNTQNLFEETLTSRLLWEESYLSELSALVLEIIEKEKLNILVKKQTDRIEAMLGEQERKLVNEIVQLEQTLKNLALSDIEVKEKQEDLEGLGRKLERVTAVYLEEVKDSLEKVFKEQIHKIEDKLDDCREEAEKVLTTSTSSETLESMSRKAMSHFESFQRRKLPRQVYELKKAIPPCIVKSSEEYLERMTKSLNKGFDETDINFLLLQLKKLGDLKEVEQIYDISELNSFWESFWDDIEEKTSSSFGTWIFGNNSDKRTLQGYIRTMSQALSELISQLAQELDLIEVIGEHIRVLVFQEFLTPIQKDLEQLLQDKDKRSQIRLQTEADLERKRTEKATFDANIRALKSGL